MRRTRSLFTAALLTAVVVVLVGATGPVQADSFETSALASQGSAAAPDPATYPGANGRIAFTDNRHNNAQIWIMSHIGGNKHALTEGPGENYRPNFTADGQKMVFVFIPKNGPRAGYSQIHMMNYRGKARQEVTVGTKNWDWPAISPDGQKVLAVGPAKGGVRNIFSMRTDGTGVKRLTETKSANDSDPQFSPDGTKIVFQRDFSDGGKGIYIMNADGSAPKRLTKKKERAISPTFAPDGQRIAFAHILGHAGTTRIFTMKTDGSGRLGLQDRSKGYFYTNPVYSPDGGKIAYVLLKSPEHPSNIYFMNINGSGVERITDGQFVVVDLDWGPT